MHSTHTSGSGTKTNLAYVAGSLCYLMLLVAGSIVGTIVLLVALHTFALMSEMHTDSASNVIGMVLAALLITVWGLLVGLVLIDW